MLLNKLSNFNKKDFNKLFGLYIKRRRIELGLKETDLALLTDLNLKEISLLETGRKKISEPLFETLFNVLQMDQNEVIELSKITQVQYLINLFKVIDENYPSQ